jgi:diguanylate cyclase (GGDEF)-like protein
LFRRWSFRTLSIGVLVVFGLATCAVGFSVWRDRAQELANGVRDLRNITVAFGGQVDRTIQSVDIVLRTLRERIVDLDGDVRSAGQRLDPDRWRDLLVPALRMVPQAVDIVVADADGRLVASTTEIGSGDVTIASSDHFRELTVMTDDRLVVTQPTDWRLRGDAMLVVARRIKAADGIFRGVVFAGVRRSSVEGSYSGMTSARDQTFSIMLLDGTILIRYPDDVDRAGVKMPELSPWYQTARHGGGIYRAPGPFKSNDRWVAVHPLASAPLFVNVGIPEEVLLEAFRFRAALTIATTAILLICAIILLGVMARHVRALNASKVALAAETEALAHERGRLLASETELRDNQQRLERREAELRVQNQRFDAALNNMSQGLAMFDGAGRLVVCNARYRAMLDLPAELARPGRPLRDIVAHCHRRRGFPADVDGFMAEISELVSRGAGTHEFREIDGRLFAACNERMADGGWIATLEDITARRAAEEQIIRLAHNDLLTGIANRSRFREQIAAAHARLDAAGDPYAVLMIDLDRFKHVNDSLGHAAGDLLLKETVRRLSSSLRSTDELARLGGDEFAVIQSPPRDHAAGACDTASLRESAMALAQRILDLIGEPYDIEGRPVCIGASIGIAMAPSNAADPDELMKKADLALYKSKADGRNVYTLFSQEMAAEADERHQTEADLRAGLARGEFELLYQPQVDVRSGRVCGMEALIRWNHPERGPIGPDQFISLAEDAGLIAPLGEWILQTACAEASRWPSDVRLAVNVSPVQFRRSALFDVILCALVESGLAPERLEIEITERVLFEHDVDNHHVLRQLKNLGISIALDDFGTGYSSLGYLVKFPFDKIKIDRSFTRDILARRDCAAIACAVIGLGRSLDIVTVAEGVETRDQLDALRVAGVHQAQGYLFGPPAAAAALSFEMSAAGRAEPSSRRSA